LKTAEKANYSGTWITDLTNRRNRDEGEEYIQPQIDPDFANDTYRLNTDNNLRIKTNIIRLIIPKPIMIKSAKIWPVPFYGGKSVVKFFS
jgi:hypothetical protein